MDWIDPIGPKRKGSSSNHPLSESDLLVSGRVDPKNDGPWKMHPPASKHFASFFGIYASNFRGGVRHPYHKRNAHTGCLGSLENWTPGLDAI